MSEKTTVLSEAETEFTAFKRALAGLGEPQMREVWLGTWSARGVVAHISGWHRELGPALGRMQRGERPIPEGVSHDNVDAWNARFADAGQDRPQDRGPQQPASLSGAPAPDRGVAEA